MIGFTMACLCEIGSHPCCSERLHISVTNGSNSSRNSLRIVVGIGSSEQDLDLVERICFLISSGLYNLNLSNTAVGGGSLLEGGDFAMASAELRQESD